MAHEHNHEHGHEEESISKELARIGVGAVLFIASIILGKTDLPTLVPTLVAAAAYIVLGFDVIMEALSGLVHLELLDENFLMTIATAGAWALGQSNEAVMVMLLYCIGELAQDLASDRSMDNIESLVDITPKKAHKTLPDGTTEEVETSSIRKGDILKVLAGEKIPTDGIVLEGTCSLDTRAITGESLPVYAKEGDSITSACVVLDGAISMTATADYGMSTASRIVKFVEDAKGRKSSTERFITRFANVYTPIVVALAALLAVVPSLFDGAWSTWVHRALVFLVVSCPCALVISVPLAFFAGMGNGASKGILFKGGEHLEKLAEVRTFVFDKTGTITEGSFEVKKTMPEEGFSENELLDVALSLESNSNHPIAKAITQFCKDKNSSTLKLKDISETAGKGLAATLSEDDAEVRLFAGNSTMMKGIGLEITEDGKDNTMVYFARQDRKTRLIGSIQIADKIKNNTPQAIAELKGKHGVKTVMLSGDRKEAVDEIAASVGMDQSRDSLLPEQKALALEELQKTSVCAYVGDGINDAPVMALSDVSFSMGQTGSDAAIEASDIVIVNDDLSSLPKAMEIADKTMKIAKQNIVFALSVKLMFLVLSSFGLAGMGLAVFADTGVALLCILNSIRALR